MYFQYFHDKTDMSKGNSEYFFTKMIKEKRSAKYDRKGNFLDTLFLCFTTHESTSKYTKIAEDMKKYLNELIQLTMNQCE